VVSENPGEAFDRHMREPDPVPAEGAEEQFESAEELLRTIVEELFGVDAYLIEIVPGEPSADEPVGLGAVTRLKLRGPREMVQRVYEEIVRRGEEQKGGGE